VPHRPCHWQLHDRAVPALQAATLSPEQPRRDKPKLQQTVPGHTCAAQLRTVSSTAPAARRPGPRARHSPWQPRRRPGRAAVQADAAAAQHLTSQLPLRVSPSFPPAPCSRSLALVCPRGSWLAEGERVCSVLWGKRQQQAFRRHRNGTRGNRARLAREKGASLAPQPVCAQHPAAANTSRALRNAPGLGL